LLLLQVGHVRRFFFIDSSLSNSADGMEPAAITFQSGMSIDVTIREDARDMIYPPVITIT
jgi:hypothetical protein